MRRTGMIFVLQLAVMALTSSRSIAAQKFEVARLYIEYNSSANDLGFHVALDGEDWKSLEIVNPRGKTIFDVHGGGPYAELGLTELFFEGAEPTLDEVPLDELLAKFPEGKYKFIGTTVDGERIARRATFTHAVPAGPVVSSQVNGNTIVISWTPVTTAPPGFPVTSIQVVGYQVLVDPLDVTLPATSTQLTLPPEFVESLEAGEHPFEVLAIDVSGNQTITEGSFVTP
jgi:hypothetical protein